MGRARPAPRNPRALPISLARIAVSNVAVSRGLSGRSSPGARLEFSRTAGDPQKEEHPRQLNESWIAGAWSPLEAQYFEIAPGGIANIKKC